MVAALGSSLAIACVPSGPSNQGKDSGAKTTSARTAKKPQNTPRAPNRPNKPKPVASNRPTAKAEPASPVNPEKDPILTESFTDTFERAGLGPDWRVTRAVWSIRGGQLCGQNARNHPVWLRRKLPVNARIEFDALSRSADGDIKAEFWGDGKGAATGVSYNNASSYLTIFGGWKNTFHVLARIDEHAKNRNELKIQPDGADLRARRVEPNVVYHFKVERADGKTIRWYVDDIEIHSLADPKPLGGPGHDHFAFNDWQVPVCFDNLVITPLGG